MWVMASGIIATASHAWVRLAPSTSDDSSTIARSTSRLRCSLTSRPRLRICASTGRGGATPLPESPAELTVTGAPPSRARSIASAMTERH